MILKDKNILLSVTGSIALYYSLELLSLFIKAGAIVKVILSQGICRSILFDDRDPF